uniref:Glycosyltransferase 2-like domain-containing protein n=1 Tax=Spongospora subterranea TaxID=70186 RepID=A0A0H5R2U9_9EUKA|eukprot:CRZ02229.1 hypothetical protein [Spongospora subterranea]
MAISIWESVQGVILTLALFHALLHTIVSVVVIVISSRSPFRPLSTISLLIVVIAHATLFYVNVFNQLDLGNMFTANRWPTQFLVHRWPIMFIIEPLLILFITWFKLACCIDAWRFVPRRSEVEKFRDDYENIKGHRDFIMIFSLSGEENQDHALAAINSAMNSMFPAHRLRILIIFYGPSSSVLDRFLISRLASHVNSSPAEIVATENLVSVQGVKMSFLRFGPSSALIAQSRAIDFISLLYVDDQQRKPVVCFQEANMLLDEMAIARFVYELDDPHRDFLTGISLDEPNMPIGSRIRGAISTGSQVIDRIAEDYSGNVTTIPRYFLVARFKALKSIASGIFSEYDGEAVPTTPETDLAMKLMHSKPTQHRVGICIGALRTMQSENPSETFVEKQIRELRVAGDVKAWMASPLLCILTLGTAMFQAHIPFYVQLFLLEYMSGRGIRIATSYIFLLILPTYIFMALAGSRFNRKDVIITIPINFVISIIVDPITEVTTLWNFSKETWMDIRKGNGEPKGSKALDNV